jgi:hypothetical protein
MISFRHGLNRQRKNSFVGRLYQGTTLVVPNTDLLNNGLYGLRFCFLLLTFPQGLKPELMLGFVRHD